MKRLVNHYHSSLLTYTRKKSLFCWRKTERTNSTFSRITIQVKFALNKYSLVITPTPRPCPSSDRTLVKKRVCSVFEKTVPHPVSGAFAMTCVEFQRALQDRWRK